eukprot:TRINITY_DN17237_c0_g1_i2.p1 TRINITY_DN17237_c0_g1~~TRINITY_DN17237_c0_g1_i2.p1  ORF type:complete len:321 (-),score=46.66 TRINITY_DN17237_c0_g1_i2:50-1012(-)
MIIPRRKKMLRIFEDVQKIDDIDQANLIFITVFQNIKSYMKSKRDLLLRKLKELKILKGDLRSIRLERREHSADRGLCKKDMVRILPKTLGSLVPIKEKPEQYIEFLIFLCEMYEQIAEVTGSGIEQICQAILAQVNQQHDIVGFDIHKSIFFDVIMKDRTIRSCMSAANRLGKDEVAKQRYPALPHVLKALRIILLDVLQYRVKISIGTEESRQLDEGECASDLSESEHSSVCEADAVYDKDGLESLTAFLIKARNKERPVWNRPFDEIINFIEQPNDKEHKELSTCLLYTSDAADDTPCVDLGGRRISKKKILTRMTT